MKRIEILIFLVLITLLVPSIALGQTQLKFCNYFPSLPHSPKSAIAFIKDLEAQSKGQLKITYFPPGDPAHGSKDV